MLVHKGRQPLPAEAGIHSQAATHLPFILAIESHFRTSGVVSGTSNRKVCRRRKALQKVAKGITRQCAIESEQPVVVGRRLDLRHREAHPAVVNAGTKRMFASDVCEVVGNLLCRGKRVSNVISADRHKACTVREVDSGKSAVGWVMRNIHILEAQLGNCGSAFNREIRRQESLRKSEAELIEQVGPDRVVVRNQETSVMLVVQIVG